MEQQDNLKYISLVIRRLWIVVLAMVIAGAGAYILRSRQAPEYQAEVKVFTGNVLSSLNPDTGLFETGERLARTYSQIVQLSSILMPVIEALELDMTFEELREIVSPGVVPDTPILTIRVTYSTPEDAVIIANEIASSLIENSPADLRPEQVQIMMIQQQQIEALNRQIAEAQDQLIELGERLIRATTDTAIDSLLQQRTRVQQQIQTDQATLAQLTASFSSLADRSNRLEVIEPARLPQRPTGLNPIIVGGAGGVVGAILAVAVILFFAYIDNKIRTEDDVRDVVRLPLLGQVRRAREIRAKLTPAVLKDSQGRKNSKIAEELRTVQANVLFSADSRALSKTFVIASPNRRDGRTSVAAHLAVISAEAGLKVLLIDADLRNPSLHEKFDLDNSSGLVTLLTLIHSRPDVLSNQDEFKEIAQKIVRTTGNPNLMIVPSGGANNALSALTFEYLDQCIEALTQLNELDMVIIDSSPSLRVSDSYVLAASINASVLLLVDAGRTSRQDAKKAKEQFLNVGSKINGVILNKA